MRTRLLFIFVTVGLLALAVGVFALERTGRDRITEGVRAGNVDVGGLRADQARAKLRREVRFALDDPVVVRHGVRRFALTPQQAGVRADIDAMVEQAVARSREGGVAARTWRRVTGDDRDINVALIADPSDRAVEQFIRRVEAAVEHRPVNADVEFVRGDVQVRPARAGVRLVDRAGLRREVDRRLVAPGVEPSLPVAAQKVAPEVSTEQVADRHPVLLVIDRESFALRVYRRLRRVKSYRVGVGRSGFKTPAGRYEVIDKQVDPVWNVPDEAWAGKLRGRVIPGGSPENPLKARWLALTEDGVGIHGTDEEDSIGKKASHGCIRMLIDDVKRLYRQVDVGTSIFIA